MDRGSQLTGRRIGEVSGEVIDQVARVVLRAMDEGRLASPEDGQSDGIQPWHIDNAAIVPQVAFTIDHRNIEPAVVRPKSGCPDDGSDLAAPQVEIEPRRGGRAGWLEPLRRADVGVARVAAPPVIERVQESIHLEVRECKLVAKSPRKKCSAVAH